MKAELARVMKQVGVLYVDVYPCRLKPDGGIEFLVFRRRPDVIMPGVWQGISGKLVEDEKISAAFLRQVTKKTGSAPRRLFKLDYVNTFYDDHYDTVMFVPSAGCLVGDEISIDERLHDAYRFVDEAELVELLPFANQVNAFRLAAEYVRRFPEPGPTHELPVF